MPTNKIRIGEAAEIIGVSIQTLRNWERVGKLRSTRSAGGQRYYDAEEVRRLAVDIEGFGWAWASSAQAPYLPDEYYCERSDRFTSRLTKMSTVFLQAFGATPANTDLISLLTLVVGEIGDNSFVHNLGSWPDVLGIFFAYDVNKRLIVLADRGRGVLTTLQNIRPDLALDTDALRVAFTEVISGRDPEKRGNGLKVVRGVAESNPIDLLFRSGLGIVQIPGLPRRMQISMANENVRGTFATIKI
ncbi:MAG: MerR family DNA-binding transcriptional regulator [Ignavibacteriae bacterium]|nr:MerR family DNA-binding transcriptional regulator [Ignavibacteriota bacterium]